MERNLNDVFEQAVQPPERDRATLAGLLIETLDPVFEPDLISNALGKPAIEVGIFLQRVSSRAAEFFFHLSKLFFNAQN